MNYAKDYKNDSTYVSVNTLIRPKKNRDLSPTQFNMEGSAHPAFIPPNQPVEQEADQVAEVSLQKREALKTKHQPVLPKGRSAALLQLKPASNGEATTPKGYSALVKLFDEALEEKDYQRIENSLAQFHEPVQLSQFLTAWAQKYPQDDFWEKVGDKLGDVNRRRLWESFMGYSVRYGELGGSTTESYFNLRTKPGTSSPLLGTLSGQSMAVRVIGKSTEGGYTWYLLQFKNRDEYLKVAKLPASPSPDAKQRFDHSQAWAIAGAVSTYLDYRTFMRQLANFEQIFANLSLKERITKLRQLCHPSDLPFDTMIGTSGGDNYQNDRPNIHQFYQMLSDAQAVKLPSGEIIDIYHFIVGLDVYQEDRIHQYRVQGLRLGYSDPSATWAGDIAGGVSDMALHISRDYEAQNPGMSYEALLDYYYRTRASEPDLLADIDAWAAYGEAERGKKTDSIGALIEQVYGKAADNYSGTPKLRKLAIQRFLNRHGLTVRNNSIINEENRDIIRFYIADFARVLVYRRQLPASFWIGSKYDKGELQKISMGMADKFLVWLNRLAIANQAFTD